MSEKTGSKKVEMYWYGAEVGYEVAKEMFKTWLNLWDIPYEEGLSTITRAEEDALFEREHLAWDYTFHTYKPGKSGKNYDVFTVEDPDDDAEHVIICIFSDVQGWIDIVKIYPPDDEDERDKLEYILERFKEISEALW